VRNSYFRHQLDVQEHSLELVLLYQKDREPAIVQQPKGLPKRSFFKKPSFVASDIVVPQLTIPYPLNSTAAQSLQSKEPDFAITRQTTFFQLNADAPTFVPKYQLSTDDVEDLVLALRI